MDNEGMSLVSGIHRDQGKRLREARQRAGLTQVRLAELVGVEQNSISRFEQGHVCPSDLMQLKLAVAVGVDVADIYAWPTFVMTLARNAFPGIADEAQAA